MKDRFERLRSLRGAPREIHVVHQGSLRPGGSVVVTLALDRAAAGTASLQVSVVREGGQPPANDGARVAPGESASVLLALPTPGRLKIVIEATAERDGGMLTVATGAGVPRDHAPIVGDTVWVYGIG